MNDGDWDDGEGRSKAFDARSGSNQPMKNQGWEHDRGAGSMRSKGREDDWDDEHWGDGSNNTNKTSPQRQHQYGNRDLRNQISGNLGDRDLRNRISGNSRERDLRNKIGATSASATNWDNTSRNRNDGTLQWGGSKEEQFQKNKWNYGDGNNQSTNEGKHNLKTEIFGDILQLLKNKSSN